MPPESRFLNGAERMLPQSKSESQRPLLQGRAHHPHLIGQGAQKSYDRADCVVENHGMRGRWWQIQLELVHPLKPIVKSFHPRRNFYHPPTQRRRRATPQKAKHRRFAYFA